MSPYQSKVEILEHVLSEEEALKLYNLRPGNYKPPGLVGLLTCVLVFGVLYFLKLPLFLNIALAVVSAVVAFFYRDKRIETEAMTWAYAQDDARELIRKRATSIEGIDLETVYITSSGPCSFIAFSTDRKYIFLFSSVSTCELIKVPVMQIGGAEFGWSQELDGPKYCRQLRYMNQAAVCIYFGMNEVAGIITVTLGKNIKKAIELANSIQQLAPGFEAEMQDSLDEALDRRVDLQMNDLSKWMEDTERKKNRNSLLRLVAVVVFPLVLAYITLDVVTRPFSIAVSAFLAVMLLSGDIWRLSRLFLKKFYLKGTSYLNLSSRGKFKYAALMLSIYPVLLLPLGYCLHKTLLRTVYPVIETSQELSHQTKFVGMARNQSWYNPLLQNSVFVPLTNNREFRYFLKDHQHTFPNSGKYLVKLAGTYGIFAWVIEDMCILLDERGQFIPVQQDVEETIETLENHEMRCL